jgi:transketolase
MSTPTKESRDAFGTLNNTAVKELPRDAFIEQVMQEAKRNKDVYFLCADLGAKALDSFRVELKEQFIHVGISEQNMMDVAAGLAQNGKIVYTYAMGPFITCRCYEQVKVALASMTLPTTIIGNGVGYSYDDAGPTHYATEDISCMRALGNIEIITPSDTQSTREAAKLTYTKPALRYIRLDRTFLPDVYGQGDTRFITDGLVEIDKGDDLVIIASGYMVQKAREVRARLEKEGHKIGIIDAFRIKPITKNVLEKVLKPYSKIVTLEEHFLSGGMGSAIVEAMADFGIQKRVKRLGIQDHYFLENGGRSYIQKLAGIDVDTITKEVQQLAGSKSREAVQV